MNRRVKAFTIMEVTVAMLLTALVIAITYTCYSIIQQGYLGFKSRQQGLVEVGQLTTVMDRDMEQADQIASEQEEVVLNSETGQIRYAILPDMVIRKTTVSDTFMVGTRDVELLFEGTVVTGTGRLDEIRSKFVRGNEQYIYHFRKRYSARQLFYNTVSNGQN